MHPPGSPADPNLSLPGVSSPVSAMVALVRRGGADRFPFEAADFAAPAFQQALLASAERHELQGVVLVELERSGRMKSLQPIAGADGAAHLRRLRRQAAMWDLERDAVLSRLARADIPVLLLKGAALRLTAYRDPAERRFGDIDVLVPEESLEHAVAALGRDGYQPESAERVRAYRAHHHHLILSRPGGFLVEVHWALEPGRSSLGLDPAAFRRDARTVIRPGAAAVLVPRPEHMVLHLAQQHVEDGFFRFRRVVDVDRVMAAAPDFSWDALAKEAQRMNMQTALAVTLRLAQLLLGTEVPSGVIGGLGLSSVVRRHLALLRPVPLALEPWNQPNAARELLMLWCLMGRGQRLRHLKDLATGGRYRLVNAVSPGQFRNGAPTRVAALAKLAAYQMFLYSSTLRRREQFWLNETT